MSSGLDVNVHVILGVETPKVDARETGVQVRGKTMADVTDTRLCLRGGKLIWSPWSKII